MSRAFVKEDERDATPMAPSRPLLPEGAVNYVTPRGLGLLRAERDQLQDELNKVQEEPDGTSANLSMLRARQADLSFRLASAQVIDPRTQRQDQVRFGATVCVRTLDGDTAGEERTFTLVGVDEADSSGDLVGFYTPIATALLGRRVGDKAILDTETGEETLEVVAIDYQV